MAERKLAYTSPSESAAFRDRFDAAPASFGDRFDATNEPSGIPGRSEAAALRTFDATVKMAKRIRSQTKHDDD